MIDHEEQSGLGIMTTPKLEIILMQYFDIRKNLIVPNVFWGMGLGYECDLVVVTKNGYATEVEIKISKHDLLQEKKKSIYAHKSNLFKYLYFAVPGELEKIALLVIPENAGLLVYKKDQYECLRIIKVKDAIKNKQCIKWDDKKQLKLAKLGAMRLLGLKKTILNLQKKEVS